MFSLRRNTPLKRSWMRRRPRRRPKLTREEWEELRAECQRLDLDAVLAWAQETPGLAPISLPIGSTRVVTAKGDVCPAVVMDPSELGNCYGEWNLDHVKDTLRLGLKADDDIWHLVDLCAGHDERGAKAGSNWNTKSENRAKERRYLREHRPERPRSGGSGA